MHLLSAQRELLSSVGIDSSKDKLEDYEWRLLVNETPLMDTTRCMHALLIIAANLDKDQARTVFGCERGTCDFCSPCVAKSRVHSIAAAQFPPSVSSLITSDVVTYVRNLVDTARLPQA